MESAQEGISDEEALIDIKEKLATIHSLLRLPIQMWQANMILSGDDVCVPPWIVSEVFTMFRSALQDETKHNTIPQYTTCIVGTVSVLLRVGKIKTFDSLRPIHAIHEELMSISDPKNLECPSKEIQDRTAKTLNGLVSAWLDMLGDNVQLSKSKTNDLNQTNHLILICRSLLFMLENTNESNFALMGKIGKAFSSLACKQKIHVELIKSEIAPKRSSLLNIPSIAISTILTRLNIRLKDQKFTSEATDIEADCRLVDYYMKLLNYIVNCYPIQALQNSEMSDLVIQLRKHIIHMNVAINMNNVVKFESFINGLNSQVDNLLSSMTNNSQTLKVHSELVDSLFSDIYKNTVQDSVTCTCKAICMASILMKCEFNVQKVTNLLDLLRKCSSILMHDVRMPISMNAYNKISNNMCGLMSRVLNDSQKGELQRNHCKNFQLLLWRYAFEYNLDKGSPIARRLCIDVLCFLYATLSKSEIDDYLVSEMSHVLVQIITSSSFNLFRNDERRECDEVVWNESTIPLLRRISCFVQKDDHVMHDFMNSWQVSGISELTGSDDWVCQCAVIPFEMFRVLTSGYTHEERRSITNHCMERLLKESNDSLFVAHAIVMGHFIMDGKDSDSADRALYMMLDTSSKRPKLITQCLNVAICVAEYAADTAQTLRVLQVLQKIFLNNKHTSVQLLTISLLEKLNYGKDTMTKKTLNDLVIDLLHIPSEHDGSLAWLRHLQAAKSVLVIENKISDRLSIPSHFSQTIKSVRDKNPPSYLPDEPYLATDKRASVDILCQKRKRDFDGFMQEQKRRKLQNAPQENSLQTMNQVKGLIQKMQETIPKDQSVIKEMIPLMQQSITMCQQLLKTLQSKK
ncbi:hypothetical protein AKO1_011208 [Acrasis kona]|uniref:Uncharacterized protein n=1 Tax=Acrasis kona TaxID=1008807 RepID=A0AAW2YWN9_9EUKA